MLLVIVYSQVNSFLLIVLSFKCTLSTLNKIWFDLIWIFFISYRDNHEWRGCNIIDLFGGGGHKSCYSSNERPWHLCHLETFTPLTTTIIVDFFLKSQFNILQSSILSWIWYHIKMICSDKNGKLLFNDLMVVLIPDILLTKCIALYNPCTSGDSIWDDPIGKHLHHIENHVLDTIKKCHILFWKNLYLDLSFSTFI